MKHRKILPLILFLATMAFASCKNQDLPTNATVKYGTSFGMCVGYCQRELSINGTQATLSLRKNGTNAEQKSCKKQIDEATLTALKSKIDIASLNKLPDVIGCPDCADGGAEFVEVTSNGKTKRITFEYGRAPAELKELVDQLKPIFHSLGDCN